MNARLDRQLECVRRALRELYDTHTPVYDVRLLSNRVQPILHVGSGPFNWTAIGYGRDERGDWTDYSAHLRGCELRRRVRSGRHPLYAAISPFVEWDEDRGRAWSAVHAR